MKAWFVWVGHKWGDYVHGNTPAEAKRMFWASWKEDAGDYKILRATRLAEMDGVPFTEEFTDGEPIICTCKLCRKEGSR